MNINDDTWIEDVLNNFRQQSIIIDANNSLGGGEKGAEAFAKSLAEAKAQIQQRLIEARKDELKLVKAVIHHSDLDQELYAAVGICDDRLAQLSNNQNTPKENNE